MLFVEGKEGGNGDHAQLRRLQGGGRLEMGMAVEGGGIAEKRVTLLDDDGPFRAVLAEERYLDPAFFDEIELGPARLTLYVDHLPGGAGPFRRILVKQVQLDRIVLQVVGQVR